MIVELSGTSLWLWYFLAYLWLRYCFGLFTDYDTFWGSFYDSWSLFMIVIFLGPLYDCDTSWAALLSWHFLGTLWFLEPLYDIDTSCASLRLWHFQANFMPLWMWHFLGPYDCDTSCGLCMIFGTSWGLLFFYFAISCDPSMIVKGYLLFCLQYHFNFESEIWYISV